MLSRSLRNFLYILVVACLISFSFINVSVQAQAAVDKSNSMQTGTIYTQPIDPNGKLFLSSWLDPDGSDNDQYVWDDFTLQSSGDVTVIEWYGGYDPLLFGKGGPVVDFTISIYPSIDAGTEPAVANPPLVKYSSAGNAGETSFGTFNGTQINKYSFDLPVPFMAAAGVKYWVQIEAAQQGSLPDWCFMAGSGGSGRHYIKTSGAGGDVLYRFMPGDAAFTLLGSMADPITPTPTVTTPPSPTDTPKPTPTPVPQVPTCVGAVVALLMFLLLFRLPHR